MPPLTEAARDVVNALLDTETDRRWGCQQVMDSEWFKQKVGTSAMHVATLTLTLTLTLIEGRHLGDARRDGDAVADQKDQGGQGQGERPRSRPARRYDLDGNPGVDPHRCAPQRGGA